MSDHDALIAELRAWHVETKVVSGSCAACRQPWPCSGVRAADALAARPAPPGGLVEDGTTSPSQTVGVPTVTGDGAAEREALIEQIAQGLEAQCGCVSYHLSDWHAQTCPAAHASFVRSFAAAPARLSGEGTRDA